MPLPNPTNYITSNFGTERRARGRTGARAGEHGRRNYGFRLRRHKNTRAKNLELRAWLESNACRKTIISEDRAHLKWSVRLVLSASSSWVELNAAYVASVDRWLKEGRSDKSAAGIREEPLALECMHVHNVCRWVRPARRARCSFVSPRRSSLPTTELLTR